MVASVLINPHLIVYDAAILALPLLWFAADILERGSDADARRYALLVYGLFLAFFIPTAALIKVQASVLLMLALFWHHSRPFMQAPVAGSPSPVASSPCHPT